MFIGRLDDEQDVLKFNQALKDEVSEQSIDTEALTYLWRKTFSSRRLFIRNHSIKEILLEYSAYSLSYFGKLHKTFIITKSNSCFTFSDF